MRCRWIIISVQEPSNFRDIVSGLQIVNAGFPIEDVATVAEGVDCGEGQAVGGVGVVDGSGSTPGIVVVGYLDDTIAISDSCYITLTVYDVVKGITAVGNGCRNTVDVGEIHHHTITGHLHQLRAVIDVLVGIGTVGTSGTHSVGVVGVCPRGAVDGLTGQLAAVLPSKAAGSEGQHIVAIVVGMCIGLPCRVFWAVPMRNRDGLIEL